MKFATKSIWHCPPHLRHVATLHWKITNSNFLQIFSRCGRRCKQIAFFVAFHFASCSPYWLQINFFSSLLFYLFTFAICDNGNSSQQTSLPCLPTINMVWNDADKILIKLIWNQYEEILAILNTEIIKICGWTTKLEAIKMQYVCISAMSAEYLQKIWIFNFPR